MNVFIKKFFPLVLSTTILFTSTIVFAFRPVVAHATAESIAFAKCMEYMFGLWGIGTKQSFDAFNGYKGYTDSEKANAIQGVKDWYDDRTRDWRNWAVVNRGIAKSKVDDWENSVRDGWIDFNSEVGSAFKDWASAFSKDADNELVDSFKPVINEIPMSINSVEEVESIVASYVDGKVIRLDKDNQSYIQINNYLPCAMVYGYKNNDWSYDFALFRIIHNSIDDYSYASFHVSKWKDDMNFVIDWTGGEVQLKNDSNGCVFANENNTKVKDKVESFPNLKTESELEGEKQLPAVVDEFGSHLPVPQNNQDPDQKPDKKYPPTVTPVYIPWKQLEPTPQPVGQPTVIIDPTIVNWEKETNITIEEIKYQLQQISIALSKVMNVVLIDELTNMSIDGKTKGKTKPNFNMDIDLRKKFPFCIPWDIYAIVGFLNAEPLAPSFDLPMPIKGSDGVIKHSVSVDFGTTDIDGDGKKDLDLNTVSKVCRVLFFILFVIGFSYIFFFKG